MVEFINKRKNVFSLHEYVMKIVTDEKIDVTFFTFHLRKHASKIKV